MTVAEGGGARRRLLFHSYYFPPIGGSGAQRPLKMVRALDGLGYDSVVVTGAGATADRWAPEDASLLAQVPEDVEIRRVPGGDEPRASTGWRHTAERWFGVRSRWSTWWARESFRLGCEVGDGVDLVYVWIQPYTSAGVGAALSQKLSRPWVADLGDPWALDEMMIYPSGVHRAAALRRMRAVLGTASAIVMSTPEAVSRLREHFPELDDRPVVAIANGFDAADFAGPRPARARDRFRIVHTGSLHTMLGEQHRRRRALRRALRGSARGVDVLTRSHVYLVEAIDRVLARDPGLRCVLELHLAGVLTDGDRRVAERCPVAILPGYLRHAESVRLLRSADLLFLPMQNLAHGVRATIVPGKTYEYLASGTPILGAVPAGDARDLLQAAGNALLVEPDDAPAMAEAIAAEIERSRKGDDTRPPDPAVVARFEYAKLATELAAVFDDVLGARRAL